MEVVRRVLRCLGVRAQASAVSAYFETYVIQQLRRAIRLRTSRGRRPGTLWLFGCLVSACMCRVNYWHEAGTRQADSTDRRQMTGSLPGACLVDMWIVVARVWGK
jgi:hypothetical protein